MFISRQCKPSVKKYGIGINHPDVGIWRGFGRKESAITNPVETVFFADAGKVNNLGQSDPDKWNPVDSSQGQIFFRTPNNNPFYSDQNYGQRTIPRHASKVNVLYMDGHGESVKNSYIGFQYSEYDPKALWDRR